MLLTRLFLKLTNFSSGEDEKESGIPISRSVAEGEHYSIIKYTDSSLVLTCLIYIFLFIQY
jgi:hypothetical protein